MEENTTKVGLWAVLLSAQVYIPCSAMSIIDDISVPPTIGCKMANRETL
jgi:hypothetical protein